ncbi:MAG: complex I NDUFA9 subunit family protein [Gammaproteobacteria bacterium]|nr:complex I NDUFA9 subunit family protein [Gammaproteobacteria bacterium]NNF60971.1 complex I NDUFA9 subunit family protein [Gammaproteobacteria bacterium]NNM21259.1 complex I NDUFA9 subunit family protein [Gammaproteobacteria bacterium]
MSDRTICVLGGTGFVGGHLVTRLANAGWRVRLLTRSAARHRALKVLPTVTIVQGDVYNPEFLRRQVAECTAVINLVGILNESAGHRDGKGFERAHVELTGKLIAACQESGVRRVLQMSSLKANAADGPSHYLRTKGEAEAIVNRARDIDGTIFQPSVVFGADDSFINVFAALLRVPSPLFLLPRANARLQPVYIGDVVTAFAQAIDNPATFGKTYQLGGPEVYSLRELIELIASSLGVRRKVIGMPDALARLQAFIMDFVPGKPFSTDNYLSLTVNSICDSNGLERLGIQPTSSARLIPQLLGGRLGRGRLDNYRRRNQSA